MDFVAGFPRSLRGHDAVWVIIDRLTKSAPFLLIRLSNSIENLCILYVREIVRLHGVPVSIILDKDLCFTYLFGRGCNPLLDRI